jgi:hypothetical protein
VNTVQVAAVQLHKPTTVLEPLDPNPKTARSELMSKGAVVSLLIVMGLTAPGVARAEMITLDAGQLYNANYLPGQTGLGRGFGFLADGTFTLSAVALDLTLIAPNGTLYQYEVFGSTNGHAVDGGLLASSAPFTLAAGMGYQDTSLSFTFNAGSFYVVNFSRVDNANLGSNIGAHYSVETSFLPHDYGILTMLEGFEGANADFPNNALIPHARLTFDTAPTPVPEPTSLSLAGVGLAMLARRRLRKR